MPVCLKKKTKVFHHLGCLTYAQSRYVFWFWSFSALFFYYDVILRQFPEKNWQKKKCIWHLEGHGKSQQAFVASGQLLFLRKKTLKKNFFSDKKKFSSALPPSIGIQYTLPRGGNFPRWGFFLFFYFFWQCSGKYVGNICFPPFLPYIGQVISILHCFLTTLDLAQNR